MERDRSRKRTLAESRFTKAQKTSDEAKSIADSDLETARNKTERLRKLRMAKEADEGVTELDKKPARKKAKPRRRA